jgi:hypothetical protein
MIEDLMVTRPTDFRIMPTPKFSVEAYTEESQHIDERYMPADRFQTHYEMRMTVFVQFFSNEAQYQHKREDALRSLKLRLYDDVLKELSEIIAISDDDLVSHKLRVLYSKLGDWDINRHRESLANR